MSFDDKDLVGLLPGLYKFACKLTRNQIDASDLVQDTCVRMLTHRHSYQEEKKLWGWGSKIMYNLYISAYRKRRDVEEYCIDPAIFLQLAKLQPTQEITMEASLLADKIKQLPLIQQEVVDLIAYQGCRYDEAAECLNVPLGTVRSRWARARVALGREA